MASEEESFLVLVHCSGKIKRNKKYGVKFTDREPLSVFISSSSTLSDVKNSIPQKLGVFRNKWVKKLFYKIPIAVVSTGVKYDTFVLAADEDIRVLFHCVRSFPEVRIHELFAKLEVGVDSSGASAPVHSSTAVGGVSSSMPVVRPSVPQVAFPSFAADLDRTETVGSVPLENPGVWQQPFEVGTGGGMIHDAQGFGEPDRVENAMRDDDSDQEPVDIIGDSNDDTGANPHTPHGPSSSGTQQYPPHFSTLNLEALGQQADSGATIGGSSTEFQIGQSFQNKDEAMLSVKDYSIRRGVEYKVLESDHLKYHGKCKEFGKDCTWLIRISLRARKSTWEVRRYIGSHTCLATSISSDHRQLDYHVICARILPFVRADAAVTIKVLQQATEADYGFRPSYRKVWMEKQKAVAQIYGDWKESYAELPRWMLETFPPCIEAFRHCKPLVSIDGTHLYGKYGGRLLLAIAQDGNSNILPIAFALVEGENAKLWSFFLSNLRTHVTPQEGVLVISDRHNGIKAALEAPENGWLPPRAFRAYCIRHVAANFSLSFKGKDARRMLVNAAYTKTETEFYYWFGIMRIENPTMCDLANRMEYDKWTQYEDSGRRFRHMTTNISECVNSMLKETRNLPVTSLVKSTYGRLAELFVVRGQTSEAQLGSGHEFCQALVKAIDRNIRDSRCFTITLYDRHQSEYTVAETIPTRNFSLGSYRAIHYPCYHAIACCAHSRLNWASYVHEVYRMSELFNVYKHGFVPPIPEGLWPPYSGPTVIPDPNMRRTREGRPKATRIRESMDQSDVNQPKRCGRCRQPGHTRRNCDQQRNTAGGDG
ncbi:uncharacterized protein LOC107610762 [Arachis ipaensis]|uniref:uncharacterized protein LOC107610762 n=1 Tax=Arachis ipaensis TaxID=130454 RepID=UPI0007AF67B7|nr:uncharacterized protein LOC107610762 [Arachis ipaensis]XP_025670045.1 uncharacterized protein LOC112769794 [Arachis hypogaea]